MTKQRDALAHFAQFIGIDSKQQSQNTICKALLLKTFKQSGKIIFFNQIFNHANRMALTVKQRGE